MKVIKKKVDNINGYLINGVSTSVKQEKVSIFGLPPIKMGVSPYDDGNLILSVKRKDELLSATPEAKPFLKKYIGSVDLMRGTTRWAIYVKPSELKDALEIHTLKDAFDKVKGFRSSCKSSITSKFADKPHLFIQSHVYQEKACLLLPIIVSGDRDYIPAAFFDKDTIPDKQVFVLYDYEDWMFSIISSHIHKIWAKTLSGRLKSDMRYSNTLVYNTFPVPTLNDEEKGLLSQYARCILKEREDIGGTLVELYNPKGMPKSLLEIHKELDNYLDTLYMKESGVQTLANDDDRLTMLFTMYQKRKGERK